MRHMGGILAVVMMLLAGLAALLLWGPLAEKAGWHEAIVDKGEPATLLRSPAKDVKASPASGRGRLKSSSAETTPPLEIASTNQVNPPLQAFSTSATDKPTQRFPTAAGISIGTDRSKLLVSFVRPTMRTSVVEHERLLETLVYLQNDPATVTFVLLRDGKVVSVNTTVY